MHTSIHYLTRRMPNVRDDSKHGSGRNCVKKSKSGTTICHSSSLASRMACHERGENGPESNGPAMSERRDRSELRRACPSTPALSGRRSGHHFTSLAPLASRMVEAPGFAPGSENTSPQESTMRIHLCSVAPGVKRRKNRRAPTPKNLAADVRDHRQQPACLNDIQFRPAG